MRHTRNIARCLVKIQMSPAFLSCVAVVTLLRKKIMEILHDYQLRNPCCAFPTLNKHLGKPLLSISWLESLWWNQTLMAVYGLQVWAYARPGPLRSSYQEGLDMVRQLTEEVPCRVKRDGIGVGERSLSTVLQGWLLFLWVRRRKEGLRRRPQTAVWSWGGVTKLIKSPSQGAGAPRLVWMLCREAPPSCHWWEQLRGSRASAW